MKNRQSNRNKLTVVAAVIVFAIPLWAMAQAMPMASNRSAMASGAASADTHSSMDMEKSMESMHQKMGTMKMSGNADYDFAMVMRMHHQGALEMAQAELDKGKDPAMRNTAKRIITSQKKEIMQFDRWLEQHKQHEASPMAK